jgi:citrate lyase subunit alpha/citrate CoA-transferase
MGDAVARLWPEIQWIEKPKLREQVPVIAINPRRQDLLDAVKGSSLPIRPIQDIKAEVERICGGKPARPKLGDRPVAVVKWVDGTVIDTIWQLS